MEVDEGGLLLEGESFLLSSFVVSLIILASIKFKSCFCDTIIVFGDSF